MSDIDSVEATALARLTGVTAWDDLFAPPPDPEPEDG